MTEDIRLRVVPGSVWASADGKDVAIVENVNNQRVDATGWSGDTDCLVTFTYRDERTTPESVTALFLAEFPKLIFTAARSRRPPSEDEADE